jgi:hypothetical protein
MFPNAEAHGLRGTRPPNVSLANRGGLLAPKSDRQRGLNRRGRPLRAPRPAVTLGRALNFHPSVCLAMRRR